MDLVEAIYASDGALRCDGAIAGLSAFVVWPPERFLCRWAGASDQGRHCATRNTCTGKGFFFIFFSFFARSQRRRPERVGARLLDIIKSEVYTGTVQVRRGRCVELRIDAQLRSGLEWARGDGSVLWGHHKDTLAVF